MEYSFYELQNAGFERTIVRLLDKISTTNKRAILFCNKVEIIEVIDKLLWTFSTNAFIPHGTESFGFEQDQQIFLTSNIKNPNSADVLLLVDDFDFSSWMAFNFSRIVIIFKSEQRKSAENHFRDLKNAQQNVNYWQQADCGWQSVT